MKTVVLAAGTIAVGVFLGSVPVVPAAAKAPDAPTLTRSGAQLEWSAVRGSHRYVLAIDVAGQTRSFSMDRRWARPHAHPGHRVTYRVRAVAQGSPWSNAVDVDYAATTARTRRADRRHRREAARRHRSKRTTSHSTTSTSTRTTSAVSSTSTHTTSTTTTATTTHTTVATTTTSSVDPPPVTTTSSTATSTHTSTVTSTSTTSSAADPPGWWHPAQHLTWYWQLQGTINNSEPVAAYDIDGFDNTASEVAALHAQGKKVICYIDVGTAENFRPDYASFPASVLGASNGWPGEHWLDIRALSILEPIMTARFQMCATKGFDAVEPDNVDGYANSSGFPLTAAEQLTYNEWVASEVHSLGMAVFQKNDTDQTSKLEPYFDGMLDEQCNQYSECNTTQPYLSAGKPVLNAEYSLGTSSFCSADNSAGIMGARFDLNLTGSTFQPCW